MTSYTLSLRTELNIPIRFFKAIGTLFLVVLALLSFRLKGQSLDSSSVISIGPYRGDASYQYRMEGRDALLDGNFELKGVIEDSLEKERINFFRFKGQYTENKPDQNWNFELGNFFRTGKDQLYTYKLQSSVSGQLHKFNIDFNKGEIDGKIQHQLYSVNESELGEPYFENLLNCESGKLKGAYEIKKEGLSLSAEISDGYASGSWLFEFKNNNKWEKWNFSNGSLSSIEWNSADSSYRIDVFDLNYEDSTEIEISTKFLSILSLDLSFEKKERLNSDVAELIRLNDELIKKQEEVINELGAEEHLSNPLINVPYYPLSNIEEKQLFRIRTRVNQADSIQAELRKNFQIRVLKNANDSLNFYLEALELVEDVLFSKCKTVLVYETDSILSFIPRSELIGFLQIDTLPAEFMIKFKDKESRSFSIPKINSSEAKKEDLALVDQLSKISLQSLIQLKQEVDRILNRYQKEQKLVELEEQLLRKQDIFENFMDSLLLYSNDPYRYTIASVKRFMSSQLANYWAKESNLERLNETNELINCLNNLDGLALAIANMPIRKEKVKAVYTTSLWNAFTYTSMTEIVKKRLYNTYADILLPYYLKEIEENLTCNSMKSLEEIISDTHFRMPELREEKTAKLEKKLSRNISAQEALELMEIAPNEKDQ